MSFNGSGVFTINTAGQPVITGTTISSTTFNSLTADLATGLTTALTKDGQSTPTANIGMGAFKITNLAAGTVASDAARLDQVQGGAATFITVTGTDTLTGTVVPALSAYATGNQFSFLVANTNTGAVTINVDGIGSKAITRTGTTALVAGDMVAGQAVEIIYDGTRFQLVNGNSFTNLKVSGTLGVTGVATFTAQPIVSSLTAALPVFTDASKGLVSNTMTGTGNVVMSTNAVLTTPALGTPSALVGTNITGTAAGLTAGTVTTNANLTGPITSVGNATSIASQTGTGTTFAMSASPTFTGTVGAVDVTTTGNTILGDASTDTLNVGNGGLVKDASGNVGIGTTTPSTGTLNRQLTINSGASNLAGVVIQNNATGTAYNDGTYLSTLNTSDFQIVNQEAGYVSIGTNSTERMRIDSSGNVGVGVTPSTWCAGKAIQMTGGSITSNPSVPYTYYGSNVYFNASNATTYIANGYATQYAHGGYDGNHIWYTAVSGTAGNAVTLLEAMRIDSSGNLLVGTTSIPSASVGGARIQGGQANAFFSSSAQTTGGYNHINFFNPNGLIGDISTSSSTTTYSTSSDYRLKENVAPMTGALAKVAALKPCTYKWKVDGSDGQGFIAHELDAVVPGCVTGEKDGTREEEYEVTPAVPAVVDADGVETTPAVQAVKGTRTVPSYQGIDTSFLVATLTAAIQEQQALIIQLQADVAALKALSA